MEGHQVVLVYCFDGGGESFPFGGFYVATNITSDEPDDIRLVFVALGEEFAVSLGLVYGHFATADGASPDADHADIDAFTGSGADDVVHMVPIAVDARAVDVLEVVAVGHGILSVGVYGGDIVQSLNLNDVISPLFALFQIILGFIAVQALGQ